MSAPNAMRRTAPIAGGLLAAIVLVVVMVAFVVHAGRPSEPPAPTVSAAAATPASAPRSLRDLPDGAPAAWPYLRGRSLVLAGREVGFDARPTAAVVAPHVVVVWLRDGRVVRVDPDSGRTAALPGSSSGPVVVDPGGNFAAWQSPSAGRAEVVVVSLRGRPVVLDRQTFPAVPSCCDNPFQVLGLSQLADLYVSLPAFGRTWTWNIYEGQEGVPHEVPDSDAFVLPVRGLEGGGHVVDVTAGEVVVLRAPETKRDLSEFSVGVARGGTYREREKVQAQLADFGDPRGRRVVYWTADGKGHLTLRTTGPGARHGADDTVLPLGLPAGLEVGAVLWEGSDRFLVDVTEGSSGTRALVRCDARTGACELAGKLGRRVLLARE